MIPTGLMQASLPFVAGWARDRGVKPKWMVLLSSSLLLVSSSSLESSSLEPSSGVPSAASPAGKSSSVVLKDTCSFLDSRLDLQPNIMRLS